MLRTNIRQFSFSFSLTSAAGQVEEGVEEGDLGWLDAEDGADADGNDGLCGAGPADGGEPVLDGEPEKMVMIRVVVSHCELLCLSSKQPLTLGRLSLVPGVGLCGSPGLIEGNLQ